jgi:hypothetical protein
MSKRIFIQIAAAVASVAITLGALTAPNASAVICTGGGNCTRIA